MALMTSTSFSLSVITTHDETGSKDQSPPKQQLLTCDKYGFALKFYKCPAQYQGWVERENTKALAAMVVAKVAERATSTALATATKQDVEMSSLKLEERPHTLMFIFLVPNYNGSAKSSADCKIVNATYKA